MSGELAGQLSDYHPSPAQQMMVEVYMQMLDEGRSPVVVYSFKRSRMTIFVMSQTNNNRPH